jgi:uncharacterized protein (UPF0333 family)
MNCMSQTHKQKRGSVLVFSLIVLSVLLSAAVAVATVSVSNRKSTLSTDKSNQSFQVANSGAELVLRQIYKITPIHATLDALAAALGGEVSCAGGSIEINNVAGGDVKVSFYDQDDALISCTDRNWRSRVVAVKSEGTAFGTTRLVETAVAAAVDIAWVALHPGGTNQGNGYARYINYASGDHTATKMCTDAGYLYPTGLCKTRTTRSNTTFEVEGSLMSAVRPDGSTFLSCIYWVDLEIAPPRNYQYFDTAATSMILCGK